MPLGLRSVGRNAFNTELTRGTNKLGFSFCIGILGIDVENAVPIAVERRWCTVCPYVIVQHPHIAQRGLGRGKVQLRQSPGGVIYEHHSVQ